MDLDPNTISSARDGLEDFVDERADAVMFEDGSRFDGMLQVAQANAGLQIQQAQDGDFDPGNVTQTFAAIPGGSVNLPAGTVIDRILISGSDLVIIAADGSVYLIENGAQAVPNLVIGDLTIPSAQLVAAIAEVPDIQTAAGPQSDGGSPGSSGNNFNDFDFGDIGNGFDFGDLLQGLGLFFAGGPGGETTEDPPIEVEPIIVDDGPTPVSAVLLEEDDLFGVFSAFFGPFEGFYGFEGGEELPSGPPFQYHPEFVFSGLGELIYDLEDLHYEYGFGPYDLLTPGFIGNLGGVILFNTDFSFLEIFGGLGNDEDGSRPGGLNATGSFNLGLGTFDIVFDEAAIDVLNTGLTSNGEPVLFQISSNGKTLYAYTVEQLEGFYGKIPVKIGDIEGVFDTDGQDLPRGLDIGEGVLVRSIFEINISDFFGTYRVELYNNLDHLPTVQGEEILPYDFPFISTNTDDNSVVTGFFQAQFQDDEPVLVKDVLEVFYDAIVAFSNDPEADLSQFGWGLEALPEFFSFISDIIDEDLPDIDPSELGTFEELYALLQVIVGLEHGAVSEKFLNTIDIETYPDLVANHDTFDADDIVGSLGTHADGYDYFNPYTEFFEYLFSDDHYDYLDVYVDSPKDEGPREKDGHHHEDCPDGSVTTYGLLGALFGADYGEAREIVFNEAMAGLATVGGAQLQSKGEDVSYTISEDGTLLQAFASSGGDDEPRLIFEVELTDQITGAFRFTLFDQIDHLTPVPEEEQPNDGTPPIENLTEGVGLFEGLLEDLGEIVDPEDGIQDTILDDLAVLEFLYDVIDSDGDTTTGSFFVEVWDDEPYYADGYYGNMLADYGLLAHEEGQDLVGRLFVGADEPGSIAFDFTQEDLDSSEDFPEGLPTSFSTVPLEYTLSNGGRTLTATYAGDTSGAVLFVLTIDPSNLTYTFELRLDNPSSGAYEGDNYEVLENINVAITGTDFDGDPFHDSISIRTALHDEDADLAGSEYNDSILGGSQINTNDEVYMFGNGGNDLLIGGDNAYNHIDGGDGDDILIGGNDSGYGYFNNELYGGYGNDLLIGGNYDDLLDGGDGKDLLRGGDGDDLLYGGYGKDRLEGGAGNDELQGDEGDDYLDGGDNIDTALFEGHSSDYDIGVAKDEDGNVIGYTVTDRYGSDGKDTLVNIEEVYFESDGQTFDLTDPVLLLNGDGALVGTYSTIQAAVDGASTGFTVLIKSGTYNESVDVNVAVHFKGVDTGGPVIVTPPSGSAFDIIGDLGAGNTVSFDNIEFRGATRSGIQIGSGDTLGDLRVTNSIFEANQVNGVEVNNATLMYAAIIGSVFIGNGQPGLSSGDGDILFYQYSGDALIRDVQITGQDRGTGAQENGIQFRADTGNLGNVTIEDVTIDGVFEKQPIAFFNYDDVNNLNMENVTVTADSTSPFFNTAVNFDGIGGDIDLTSGNFVNLQFPNLGVNGDVVALQGDSGDNELTGGDEDNFLRGYDGNDTLTGNGGNDVLMGLGDDDDLFGGAGNDTLVGGAGENELTGGADADLFVFTPDALDGLLDQVLDYDLAEGDQVDVTTLFDVATDGQAGDTVADFVSYDNTTGDLSVDADGSGGGAAEVVATFTNTPVNVEVLFTDSATPGDDTTTL